MQCAMVTHISVNHNRKRYFLPKNISLQKNIFIKKAKDYDTNWLRNAVSDYVLASPQKVKHLKDNPRGFLRIRVPREDNNTLHHGYMDILHAYCMKYML